MYAQLADFAQRPEPFSRYTTDALWTDPHIGRQMLAFHLDPDIDAACRKAATIDATVGWLDARFGLAGKRVLDLGCGPGLYATRMAALGADVTGLDFSPVSIAHAMAHTPPGFALRYLRANYLQPPLPGPADLVTLIYGDYCAMSPDRRHTLLNNIGEALAPGGRFIFDVFSPGQFSAMAETTEFSQHEAGGFWSPKDHFTFKRTFLYPDQLISLERYLVADPDRSFEIFNWMQYYTPASITAELAASGFHAEAFLEIGSGTRWQGGPTPFFVVASAETISPR